MRNETDSFIFSFPDILLSNSRMRSESLAAIASLPLPYTVLILQSLNITSFLFRFPAWYREGRVQEGSGVQGSESLLADNLPFVSRLLTYLILNSNI